MQKLPFSQTFLGLVLVGVVVGVLMIYLARFLSSGPTVPQGSAPKALTDSPATVSSPNEPSAAQEIAPPRPAEAPRSASGRFEYKRQVAVLGSGFYGWKLPLTLETVENDPANRLVLHFVVENQDDEAYSLSLSHPRDTAIAIDDTRAEYRFLSSEDIDDLSGLTIPAFSRRRFFVSFQPLTTTRSSLRVQLVFELKYGSNSSGVTRNVEISDIPVDHLSG